MATGSAVGHNVENLREEVVNNMILNDAMKQMAAKETKISVNCCQRPLHERPTVGSVVGNVRMCVVQICNRN
jgi:hypothetical protein